MKAFLVQYLEPNKPLITEPTKVKEPRQLEALLVLLAILAYFVSGMIRSDHKTYWSDNGTHQNASDPKN